MSSPVSCGDTEPGIGSHANENLSPGTVRRSPWHQRCIACSSQVRPWSGDRRGTYSLVSHRNTLPLSDDLTDNVVMVQCVLSVCRP